MNDRSYTNWATSGISYLLTSETGSQSWWRTQLRGRNVDRSMLFRLCIRQYLTSVYHQIIATLYGVIGSGRSLCTFHIVPTRNDWPDPVTLMHNAILSGDILPLEKITEGRICETGIGFEPEVKEWGSYGWEEFWLNKGRSGRCRNRWVKNKETGMGLAKRHRESWFQGQCEAYRK